MYVVHIFLTSYKGIYMKLCHNWVQICYNNLEIRKFNKHWKEFITEQRYYFTHNATKIHVLVNCHRGPDRTESNKIVALLYPDA